MTSPVFVSMRPNTVHDPDIETVEEATDMGLAEILPPSANNWVDLVNEFHSGNWNPSECAAANLVLKVLNRFLARIGIKLPMNNSTSDFLCRQPQGAFPSLDLVAKKLKALAHMNNASFLQI